MKCKEYELPHGWRLMAHPSYSLYVDMGKPAAFQLVDEEDDTILKIDMKKNMRLN